MAKHPTPKEQQARVNIWNRKHAHGRAVDVKLDDGTVKRTVTQSEAWLLGGHTAVILLEGIVGGYSLARVTPV